MGLLERDDQLNIGGLAFRSHIALRCLNEAAVLDGELRAQLLLEWQLVDESGRSAFHSYLIDATVLVDDKRWALSTLRAEQVMKPVTLPFAARALVDELRTEVELAWR